jgi:iron uptake system component EfeO
MFERARYRRVPARLTVLRLALLTALSCSLSAWVGGTASRADTAAVGSFDTAIAQYRSKLVEDVGQSVASVRKLRDSVAGGDLAAAKQAWIEARVGWERSEVFTSGFAPDLDRAIDAWPNGATGFHAIEAKLFGTSKNDVGSEVDALLRSLSDMAATADKAVLTPQGLFDGLTRLAYEVGESKLDGGESYLSGTSIDDMRHNVEGIDFAYQTIFATALDGRDPQLHAAARRQIDELQKMLAERDLRKIDQERLRAVSEELVLTLQTAAPEIALTKPALELE